jgi:choline dehydrogenase-like flavoprotein
MRIVPREDGDLPGVHFDYRPTDEEQDRRRRREKKLLRLFLRLGLVPYARIDPGPASSIHYAGTLPVRDDPSQGFGCRADGRLWDAPRVFVADSASWRFLPAKGLTYTLMANAERVAENVARDLQEAT